MADADRDAREDLRRLHRGLGRGRRDGGQGPRRVRRRRPHAGGRPAVGRAEGRGHDEVGPRLAAARGRPPRPPLRRVRRLPRRLGHRGRALHGRGGRELPLVPRPHARRAHQPLGPHLAALRALGLQGPEPRRAGRRLADLLRRHQAVLRQAGRAGGPLRQQRGTAQRPRRHLPAPARAALPRAADEEGLRRAGRALHPLAAVHPHPPAQRPARLPLLRPVRPRVRDALELLGALRSSCPPPSPPAS